MWAEVTLGKADIFCLEIGLLEIKNTADDVFIYHVGFDWEASCDWGSRYLDLAVLKSTQKIPKF